MEIYTENLQNLHLKILATLSNRLLLAKRYGRTKIAALHNIPLVSGENQAEYGNNVEDNYSPLMDQKFYSTADSLDEFFLSGFITRYVVKKL